MSAASVAFVQTTAVNSAVLIAGVAAFKVAPALGAPFGDAVFGGLPDRPPPLSDHRPEPPHACHLARSDALLIGQFDEPRSQHWREN